MGLQGGKGWLGIIHFIEILLKVNNNHIQGNMGGGGGLV